MRSPFAGSPHTIGSPATREPTSTPKPLPRLGPVRPPSAPPATSDPSDGTGPLRGEASDVSSSAAQGSRWPGAATNTYRGTWRLGHTSEVRSTRSTKTSANGTRAPSGSPTTTSLRGVGHGRHRPGERGRTQGRRAGGGTRGPPRSSGYGMRRQRGRSWTPFGIQGSVVWSR